MNETVISVIIFRRACVRACVCLCVCVCVPINSKGQMAEVSSIDWRRWVESVVDSNRKKQQSNTCIKLIVPLPYFR